MLRDRWPIRLRAAGATLLLTYATMVAAAAVGAATTFVVVATLSYLADAALTGPTAEPVAAALRRWQLGVTFRFLLRELLLVWLYVGHGRPTAASVAALLTGLGAVHLGRLGYLYLFARTNRLRRGLLRWRNLDVDGLMASPAPPLPVGPVWPALARTRFPLHFDVALALGVSLAWRRSGWPLTLAAAVAVIASVGLVVAGLRQYLQARRGPTALHRNSLLQAALTEFAPEVVVYFSSAVTSTYALNVWLETIGHFDRRCVIYLREAGHVANLLPTRTPVVVLPTAGTVERFHLPSVRVALYPTTVIKNNHMLRLTGMRHIFINHGDGDKSVTYSPLHRVFDEIWVAGEAARERYLTHHVGVRDEQIRLVGRPQLAHVHQAQSPPAAPFTVLYAPTWEGNFDDVDYSSVATMGEAILAALLAGPTPIRVLLKPHPATGQRSPAARRARRVIEEMISAVGPPHQLLGTGPDALYTAFDACDLLIGDVSSVVADFLASRKPYIVTNPRGSDPDDMRREMPSTTGGHLLGPDLDGLADMLTDSFGPDTLRERRRELARYFLGEPLPDPIGHFVALVDATIDRADKTFVAPSVIGGVA